MITSYRAENRIAHHVAANPTTLVECLKNHFKLNEGEATDLIRLGAIYQNKRRVFQNIKMNKGAYIRVHLKPKRYDVSPIDWKSILIADEKEFIVLNKPYGIPVHATLDNHEENVLTQMRKALGGNLYVTQRLDVPVGGLLVFAKTKDYQAKFNRLLSLRKVDKIYTCLTTTEPKLGHFMNYMEPSERSPKKMSLEKVEGWLPCELKVESTKALEKLFESRIQLLTGRTHQIRAQMALLGAPLINDNLYGGETGLLPSHKIGLFCSEIGWENFYFARAK